jgi:hypothetical protein
MGVILLACAAVIALLGFAYNGYQEDNASPSGSTLAWAIPWAAATLVLAVLVVGSLLDAGRREHWSWLALGLGLVMALGLVALFAWF